MVKRGTRLIEGINVSITRIDQISTPQPTTSDKDAADLCQKIRYLIDQIETLNSKDFATQTTLDSILSQLDMTLSALRDALKGDGNKDLSTLEADVESIDAKVATESTLSSILGQLDVPLSEIKAAGTETPRTLSNLYDLLSSINGKDFATEATLSSIDSKISSDQPRHITNAYDSDNDRLKIDAQVVANPSNLDVALSTRASESTLSSVLSQLDITLSALRDALRGASNKDFTTLESDVESILSKLDIALSAVRDAAYDSENDRKKISIENDAVGLAKSSDISATQPRDVTDRAARVLGQITDGSSPVNPADFGSNTHPRNITQVSGVALTGRNWSDDFAKLQNIDIMLSALRDALLAEEHVYSQLVDADETSAQSITLDTKGHKMLEVYAEATAATTFTLEFSHDNANWITFYSSPSPETSYGGDQTLWNGYRYARLRSAAAGASGDTVSLYLGAK